MSKDTKYLQQQRGGQWRVRMKVPPEAVEVVGKPFLLQSLKTKSLDEAIRRKYHVVAHFQDTIAEALKTPEARRKVDKLAREAIAIRQAGGSEIEAEIAAEEVARYKSIPEARMFYDIATGEAIPLALYMEPYLDQASMTRGVQSEARRALNWLGDWCHKGGIERTVQAITPKRASDFVEEVLKKDRSYNSVNKYIACLSGYWKFLVKRREVSENVWQGQRQAKPKAHLKRVKGTVKRPFTDEEIKKLLMGAPSGMMLDLMHVAALSGMRLEEIASLRYRDCLPGSLFDVTKGKTPASIRQVPIHSAIARIVARRISGKALDDLLFHELPKPIPSEPDRHGAIASKLFTQYRRSVGVEEMAQGARKSNVDFHSFRRWFITKAGRALADGAVGFTAWTVADVVGHDRKYMELGMTLGVYAGGSSEAAKRACVEAVILPI